MVFLGWRETISAPTIAMTTGVATEIKTSPISRRTLFEPWLNWPTAGQWLLSVAEVCKSRIGIGVFLCLAVCCIVLRSG
jgi:hypothetical protein